LVYVSCTFTHWSIVYTTDEKESVLFLAKYHCWFVPALCFGQEELQRNDKHEKQPLGEWQWVEILVPYGVLHAST
jgi:hypothetical protein